MRTKLMVFAAVLLMASVAFAQPGQGRRGGAGGFGRGGAGFGGGFGGGGPLALLRMEEVQKELELTDEQKSEIQKLAESQRGQRGQGGDRQNFQNLSQEERQQRFAQLREQAEARAKETREKLAEILLPHQSERLDQLVIQQQGINALNNPEVQAKLELTDDQKEKLRQVPQELREQLFQGGGRGEGDAQARREQFEKFRTEMESKMLAVLTDAQKQKFEELKGKKFDFPQPTFGQRGGGQRGQRRGGNN